MGEDDEENSKQSEANVTLSQFLVSRYADLRSRLARRLGSSEWAEDALHDTYLKLAGADAAGTVRNPAAYLFRSALHAALDRRRAENRRLGDADVDALMHIADETPGPARIVEGRNDVERLALVIEKLPPRRREILLAARLDGLSRREIAERFGISVSMVEQELRAAQEYCAARLRWHKSK